MLVYAVRRILHSIVLLLLLLILIFFVTRIIPGDPAFTMLDTDEMTDEQLDDFRRRLGLDQPFHVQFGQFVSNLARGNLGMSFHYQIPVTQVLARAIPHTIFLALTSVFFIALLAVPLGIFAAMVHRRYFASMSLTVISLLGVATPNFWFGLMALVVFSYHLGWFPLMGVGDGTFASTLRHLVLPVLTISTGGIGMTLRMTRSCMLEVMGQDYIRTARSKGLSERTVIFVHALRNALVNVITVIGLNLAFLLAGTVLVETVFTRYGLGRVVVNAIFGRDYNVIQGGIAVFCVFFVLVNLIVDLTYGLIDPRIRESHEGS